MHVILGLSWKVQPWAHTWVGIDAHLIDLHLIVELQIIELEINEF